MSRTTEMIDAAMALNGKVIGDGKPTPLEAKAAMVTLVQMDIAEMAFRAGLGMDDPTFRRARRSFELLVMSLAPDLTSQVLKQVSEALMRDLIEEAERHG